MQVRALCLKLSWVATFEIPAFFIGPLVRRLAVAKKSPERFETRLTQKRRPTDASGSITFG